VDGNITCCSKKKRLYKPCKITNFYSSINIENCTDELMHDQLTDSNDITYNSPIALSYPVASYLL
jgi:hypothetical protein